MRVARSVICACIIALSITADARAHYKPGSHNALHAIARVWCGKDRLRGGMPPCGSGQQAARIARCEASARYWSKRPQEARNGQYRGMFQMGEWERATFGHGPSVWHQARAAKRYYNVSWWHPWECADLLGIT